MRLASVLPNTTGKWIEKMPITSVSSMILRIAPRAGNDHHGPMRNWNANCSRATLHFQATLSILFREAKQRQTSPHIVDRVAMTNIWGTYFHGHQSQHPKSRCHLHLAVLELLL